MKNVLAKLTNTTLTKAATLLVVGSSALFSTSMQAGEIVYVTAYKGGTREACPPICYLTGLVSLSGGANASTAPGAPQRDRYVFGYSSDFTWSVQPTLAVPGGVYKIDIAHPTYSSTTPDAIVTATTPDGALSASAANSPVFNATHNGSSWHHLAYITNNPGVTQPLITFSIVSGTINNTGTGRINIDAFRFTEVDPCLDVAAPISVTGPLASGQTFVNVTGVDAGASSITVYADGSQIGQRTSGIVAGDNSVPTSGLSFGSQITAKQTKNGCDSPLPLSGPVVGGGANPTVKAFLSIGKAAGLPGPIGAHTTNAFASTYTLKAGGLSGGSQSAPTGGQDLFPGQCWETVTFDHAVDSAINPNDGATPTYDAFGALDALVFAIDGFAPDSGPYDIYVDRIMNGDVVIEDFESYAVGGTGFLRNPNAATQPNPVSAYLSAPNSSVISTNNSFDGTKSARIRFQYANNSAVRWARILMNATAGKHYPQIDTTKPITIRYLVLPVGQTVDKLSLPTVPATQTKSIGSSVTLTVAASGDAPYSYQWKYEGNDIPDATTSSYSKSNLQVSDTGVYSVSVSGTTCSASASAVLTVTEVIDPPTLNYSVSSGQVNFTWSGSFMLQSRSAVNTGTWTDINASGAHSEALNSSTTKFFRLRQN